MHLALGKGNIQNMEQQQSKNIIPLPSGSSPELCPKQSFKMLTDRTVSFAGAAQAHQNFCKNWIEQMQSPG